MPKPSVPKVGSEELPIHEVKAKCLKLDVCDGSVWAVDFPISLMAASFHDSGTVEVDQQMLNRSSSALSRDGHLLKTIEPDQKEMVMIVI